MAAWWQVSYTILPKSILQIKYKLRRARHARKQPDESEK
jgi:hypothetical protein